MKNLITFLLIVSTLTLFSQTTEELLMAKEINELRTNPKSFIGDIEEYIMFQVKSSEDIKNGTSSIKSSDGKKDLEVINRNIEAAKEVIDILENMEPLSKVHFNIDMYMITKAHGEYLTNNNKFSHRGENNSTLSDRFNNINVEDLSENITNVGFRRSTFKPLIIQLLIDSGIENRSHRKNLLDPNDKFISIYIGKKIYVQNFAK